MTFLDTHAKKAVAVVIVVGTVLALVVATVSIAYAGRIVPNTFVGSVQVGGLTREAAAERIQERLDELDREGIEVRIQDRTDVIQTDAIGLEVDLAVAVDDAFAYGHSGSWWRRATQRFAALWQDRTLSAAVIIDESLMADRLDDLGLLLGIPKKDLRLHIEGATVELLTDTQPGKTIDRQDAREALLDHVTGLRTGPITIPLKDDVPRVTMASALDAADAARRIIAVPIVLNAGTLSFSISRTLLASWLENVHDGDQLTVGVDRRQVAQYVTEIADRLNVAPVPAGVETKDGLITGFTPPQEGRAVQEDETLGIVLEVIAERAHGRSSVAVRDIPMKRTAPPEVSLGDGQGIKELIGSATTLFTGSPKNRIWNITNGAKFLSGIVIKPDEVFSTVQALGTIDNTTGYLPELVIKGDRTIPEFGGGLCQVSTTLFRAALDAGLPITERQNHSRRVSYYEKDERGVFIGPGLDATIYDTGPDLKFLNDTGNPILVISYVVGSKITFELYGTRDGRTSEIIGPTALTSLDPGDPVYIETDALAPGQTKQVEWAISGGSAVATYQVTYPDGHQEVQEFRSYYRRWPDKFLVGPAPFPVSPPLEEAAVPVVDVPVEG